MPPKKKAVKKSTGTKKTSRRDNLPAKKKTGRGNVPAKKAPRSDLLTVETEATSRAGRADEPIADYLEMRQVLMGGASKSDQLKYPKQYNGEWSRFWLAVAIFLVGIPFIIYIVYQWTKPGRGNEVVG